MTTPQIGKSRIPEHLKRIGMSQAEYARRLNVSESFASQLASGDKTLSLIKAKISAHIFGCYIDDLYYWENLPEKGIRQ